MTHPPAPPEPTPARASDDFARTDRAVIPAPTWVKVSVAILLILLLAVVVLHLTGNGSGRHAQMERITQGTTLL